MNVYLAWGSIVFGSAVTFAFGTWSESLTFLLVAMAIDYITGIAAAIYDGSGLDSKVGFWGLMRKGLILLVVLLSHRIDLVLGADLVMGGAVMFYIVNELLSIIENYGRLGLPLPPQLKQTVRTLRNRRDKPDEEG